MYSQHPGRIHGASIFTAKNVSSVGSMHENTGITAHCIGCKSVHCWTASCLISYNWRPNCMDETPCTSLHCVFRALIMPPLDGGGGHAVLSSKRTDLQSLRPPSRPTGQVYWAGQSAARPPHATQNSRPWSVNWGEGLSLINSEAARCLLLPVHAYQFRESIIETRERERESVSIIDFSIIV